MPVPHIILLDEHVTRDTIRTSWIMVHRVFTFHEVTISEYPMT